MENMSQGTPPVPGRNSSSKKWLYLSLAGVGAIAVLLLWVLYLGPDAQRARELDRNYDIAMNTIANFEEAMRNDTYGGETPQETLELFIHALNKGDMDLAAKYFVLETDGTQNKKLTQLLFDIQKNKEMELFLNLLSNVEPNEEDRISEDDYKFIAVDGKGDVVLYIDMTLNEYSGVWKIDGVH